MAAPRRRITAREAQARKALMRVVNWVHILVIRRLFDAGRSTEDVVLLYDLLQKEAGRIALLHAMPDWHYVDEKQVADEVYDSITKGGE